MPACACSSVTPGLSRAISCNHMYLFLTSLGGASTAIGTSVCMMRGTHRSGALPTVSPENSGGVTPIISNDVFRTRILRPTIAESNAKRPDENLLLDDLRRATQVVASAVHDLLVP